MSKFYVALDDEIISGPVSSIEEAHIFIKNDHSFRTQGTTNFLHYKIVSPALDFELLNFKNSGIESPKLFKVVKHLTTEKEVSIKIIDPETMSV